MLVAMPAFSSGSARRSMMIFGAQVFTPTSMPTWATMPRKSSNTEPSPSSLRQSIKLEVLSFGISSSIFVRLR